jgi:hypothetical protein
VIPEGAYPILDMIASGESGGRYDELYGGGRFEDYSWHPNVPVPIPGSDLHSTAAGKYQLLDSTWDHEAWKLGLTDFSPASQDEAAWDLAETTYRDKTGRDLLEDWRNGDAAAIRTALSGQWPSLRSGASGGAVALGGLGFGAIGSTRTGMEREAAAVPKIKMPEKGPAVHALPALPALPKSTQAEIPERSFRRVAAPRFAHVHIPAGNLAANFRSNLAAIRGRSRIRG